MLNAKIKGLIKTLYESEKSISFIIKELNITREEAVWVLQTYGHDVSVNRTWTEEDDRHLASLSTYMAAPEIADVLNRTPKAVSERMQKLGLKSVLSWTEEDENYLMDYWGFMQVEAIANTLNRSVRAVRLKAAELNLLSAKNEAGFLKINDIATITGLSPYKIKSFEKEGLKIKTNYITRSSKYFYVDMEELLEFLEEHQELYNAAKFELSYFYGAPDWLRRKKERDMLSNDPQRKKWTMQEKSTVKQMFFKGIKIAEIAKVLKRTEASIQHVCYHD